MSPKPETGDEPRSGEDHFASPSGTRRVLSFWPNPVPPEHSKEAGQRMLTGTVVWFVGLVIVLVIIAAVVALTA